ncbi:MAG: hypothetical protein ACKV2V_11640 [Blastocatellia bacterium]
MKKTSHHNRPVRRSRVARGFTMIEVVVASLVTLVGLLSVAQLFIVAAAFGQSSRQVTLATTLAQRRMEQLLAVPISHASLAYAGSLNANGVPTGGTTENYYMDHDRNGVIGTRQIRNTPFYTGQTASYTVTWVVLTDSVTPAMPGLRRIVVRAEASRAALKGIGAGGGTAAREIAQMSTIRTPAQ